MRDLYETILDIHVHGGAAALATVIGTLGSTPGKNTMKMLVRADGTFLGSVGGGCVEAEVIERGREVARTERAQRFVVDLNEQDNPETGLICGGRIEIFIEPITMPTIFLFGGGHVARAICATAVPCGFRVAVADDRDDFATEERFPLAAQRVAAPWEKAVAQLAIGPADFAVVLTRGHKDDMSVLRELAKRPLEARYLGLIGSKSKHLTLTRHLRDEGVSDEFLARIKTPIGLDIGARSAPEIAVSVLAELIRIRRLLDAGPDARKTP